MSRADSPSLDERLDSVPAQPGVYLLKDRSGTVIYVGKAKSLRSRVASYFRGGDERYQVRFLVNRLADLECLVTQNEKQALILENNLIKQYKPRYNIRLKDDKSYVSVKITSDAWPRVLVTRKIVKDGGRYFGPFHSAYAVRETLDVIRKVFPLRTCSDAVFRNRTRPCLEYQIKRCLGPCCLPVDREEYEQHLRAATLLLEGKDRQLEKVLAERMARAADELRFEDAARLRDQLRALQKTSERQQIVSHGGGDQDVFGLYREGGFIEAQVLMVRNGKLTANQSFEFNDWELPDEEVLSSLLTQFYQGERVVPDEILLPHSIDDAEARAELLTERRGRVVEILVPQRGDKVRLIELAQANARQAFTERQDSQQRFERIAKELKDRLHLANAPKRIECVDISTFQGGSTVASVVAFDEGEPDAQRYRRFRIRTVEGNDDFASMREVLRRRLAKGKEQNDLPDLLVIDGGKGQLGIATTVCRELELDGLDVVGLAKLRVERNPRASEIVRLEERVFLPGRKNPVVLPRNSNALFLLQRVRDEAHRFAITYHQKLRDRARLSSPLDAIVGIGATRRRSLLRHFGSLARVRAASVEELAQAPGVSSRLAHEIRRALDAGTHQAE
ncbi:MAG TPA: excinuclease ABC subunit UvrC [Candidatus Bathyarchaeia archaeon]|nr:excinuclease ABC subunit UvrC [Candidatus Bathyarchaeia archaeon]